MSKEFNQEEWSIKIKEASAKLDSQNLEKFNPAFNHSGSGEIMLPDNETFTVYRVPINMWYDYYDAKYNTKMDRR